MRHFSARRFSPKHTPKMVALRDLEFLSPIFSKTRRGAHYNEIYGLGGRFFEPIFSETHNENSGFGGSGISEPIYRKQGGGGGAHIIMRIMALGDENSSRFSPKHPTKMVDLVSFCSASFHNRRIALRFFTPPVVDKNRVGNLCYFSVCVLSSVHILFTAHTAHTAIIYIIHPTAPRESQQIKHLIAFCSSI